MNLSTQRFSFSRNTLVLLLLGFSSGLPLALTAGTLQAWMTVEGIGYKTIGFFSLVGQAYIFKFLWAPLMDRYSVPVIGRRRGWLLLTQCLLMVLIAAMGLINPQGKLALLAVLAVAIAFCSASQDIVFDAWKADSLSAKQRGKGVALSVLGYRLAMLVSGGLALWIADRYLGWAHTYWLMAVLMILGIIGTLLADEPDRPITPPTSLQQAFVAPLKEFFSRDNAWLMITLIIFYKLGDAFASALSTTFLIRGLGFSAGDVGLVNKSLGLLATIIGALYGGSLMQKMSLYRALMIFGVAQAVSNLAYWILSVTPSHLWSMGAAIFIENLCGGMGTTAAVALLLALCNRNYSATQFALLSALSAIGRVYVGPIAGWLVELWNWPLFYAFTLLTALPGLFLLWVAKSSLLQLEQSELFTKRTRYLLGYTFAKRIFFLGGVLGALGLLSIFIAYLFALPVWSGSNTLTSCGFGLCVFATIGGVILDLACRRKET